MEKWRVNRYIVIGLLVMLFSIGGACVWRFAVGDGNRVTSQEYLWFRDVTQEAGIDFVHDAGDLSQFHMPQIHGSGVAIFDFDRDRQLDLYFLNQGKSTNRLYKNLGQGKFKDVSEGSGLGIGGESTGVIVGDVNNDGWPDVLVVQYGGLKLFLNDKGKFKDVTAESGLKNPLWGTSANFFDYDRDGWLDLVVVNFLEYSPVQKCYNPTNKRDYCGPLHFPGTVSKLFRNLGGQGKGVRFEDVTVKAGLARRPGPGLGVYCADFTGDGWPDIFIANDNKPNHLWINQQDGTFKEEAYFRGIALDSNGHAQAGMGIAVGDANGDGLFDVYVTHLATERNTLWEQRPRRGRFVDSTAQAGLLKTDWRGTGFGTVMADFDQDGWPDLAVANGAVFRGTITPNPSLGMHFRDYAERNQLFRNEGMGKFRDISSQNGPLCGTPNVARGLAVGDLDGDGALDVVVTTVAERARVFHNVAQARGHWLIVRAFDPRWNRDAYGAELIVNAGGRRLLRIVNPGDSYQCSSDPRAHFGLGRTSSYDSIHVRWPDDYSETFPGGDADRAFVLERGKGTPTAGKRERK